MSRRGGPPPRFGDGEYTRMTICEEAARIMDQHGIRDFQAAKTKAARRLGFGSRFPLPSNREVEAALERRLRLFDGEAWSVRCRRLWALAAATMEMFAHYQPRVVGALLRGAVTEKTPLELHLFADTPEDIAACCHLNRIPFESFEKRVKYRRERYARIPAFRFAREGVGVEALAFSRKAIREAPLCPVAGRPMERVALDRVREIQSGGGTAQRDR